MQLCPQHFADYELIDSGDFEKLERFGNMILRRPEPQAIWSKSLSVQDWEKMANAYFVRKTQNDQNEIGNWTVQPKHPDRWWIEYKTRQLNFFMRLGLTGFKHVGVFPEQACNWDYIAENLKRIQPQIVKPKVLNLFAYTGGASLAAAACGAEVVHVDSVKQVITWSNDNMEKSSLSGIRWVVEDAAKFVQREVNRGNVYNGIICDPPAYGRGPNGEKWIIEKQLNSLLANCSKILAPTNSFFILNLYSLAFSSIISVNLANEHFTNLQNVESGELFVPDKFNKQLPLGTFLRFSR